MAEETKCRIYKSQTKRSALTNSVIETNELTVVGDNLKECKKIFDEKWSDDGNK